MLCLYSFAVAFLDAENAVLCISVTVPIRRSAVLHDTGNITISEVKHVHSWELMECKQKMSTKDDEFAISSDSDVALADAALLQAPLSRPISSSEDPDWVRNFTPAKQEDVNEDSDSVINLVSDEDVVREGKDGRETKKIDEKRHVNDKSSRKSRASARPRSSLPLISAPRLDESLTLLQAEDGNLELSGDIGAVGRVKIDDNVLMLDIKGILYRACPYACNSMCVVTVGEDDARITAVMDHAVTLHVERNLFAGDDMTVEGKVFEDDVDAIQPSQDSNLDEGIKKKEGQTSVGKNRRKSPKAGQAASEAGKAQKSIGKGRAKRVAIQSNGKKRK